MLKIIQILALSQGIFLGYVLLKRREEYKKPTFWYFIGCVVAITLSSIGDDDYNLIFQESKWYFFHEPLIITFFFLFVRNMNSERNTIDKRDFVFLLPYIFYLLIETLSNFSSIRKTVCIDALDTLVESSFMVMLLYSIYSILQQNKAKWLLAFVIPFSAFFILDEASKLFHFLTIPAVPWDSFGLFLTAIFLFYFATFKLIMKPKEILPALDSKYKSSNLESAEIESLVTALKKLMSEKKIFKTQKLNVGDVAIALGISRQQLSEILNVHMGIRFQDLLNQYRVEEFIQCLGREEYKNYTLFGLAMEVGFSSKSSFNSTFKKLKGTTPSLYKSQKMV